MSFEYFIGGRYLRAKQKESFISLITILSVAGVTVGVMALIVVIAVMAGFESDLKQRILGVESHIVLMRHDGSFSGYKKIAEQIKELNGVEAATPFIYSQIMLRSSTGVSGAVLRGVDPESAGSAFSRARGQCRRRAASSRRPTPMSRQRWTTWWQRPSNPPSLCLVEGYLASGDLSRMPPPGRRCSASIQERF